MICTLVRLDSGAPFVERATLETNDDGSVSFILPDGMGYAGQYPLQYGVRNDGPLKQPYQRATLKDGRVTFLGREGDTPWVYLYSEGQVYPS